MRDKLEYILLVAFTGFHALLAVFLLLRSLALQFREVRLAAPEPEGLYEAAAPRRRLRSRSRLHEKLVH